MKRNVGWTANLWEPNGKEIRTRGFAYVGSATSKDLAILWSYSGGLYEVVNKIARGEKVTQDECAALVNNIQTKLDKI